VTKLKTITIESATGHYWHVLYGGDTVGNIAHYSHGWVFQWLSNRPHAQMSKVQDAIFAVAKEKEIVLNIARRLTA